MKWQDRTVEVILDEARVIVGRDPKTGKRQLGTQQADQWKSSGKPGGPGFHQGPQRSQKPLPPRRLRPSAK